MRRNTWLATLLWGLCATGAHAALSAKALPDGGLALSDGAPLGTLRVMAWDRDWNYANALSGVSGQVPGTLRGTLKLPGKCVGEVTVALDVTARADGCQIDLSARFSQATLVNTLALQLDVPLARLQGRQIRACPRGEAVSVGADPFGTTFSAAGIAAGIAPEQVLLLTPNGRPVMLQDNRRFGAETASFRFVLASGQVKAGQRVRQLLGLQLCGAAEADARSRDLMPETNYDTSRPALLVAPEGTLTLMGPARTVLARAELAVHGRGWALRRQTEGDVPDGALTRESRTFAGHLSVPGTEPRHIEYAETVRGTAGGFAADYRLTRAEASAVNSLHLSWHLPIAPLLGRSVELVGERTQTVALPEKHGELHLARQVCREVRLWPERPDGLVIRLDPATPVLVQDNRRFGMDELEVRFELAGDMDRDLPAGEVALTLDVRLTTPPQVLLAAEMVQQRTNTDGWFAYPLPWDSCPVDVSFLNDGPAGQHGFLTCRDGRFVFADGTPARFWGTCFSAGENFPTHEQSEKIARRLARFGVNIVRTHHADADWAQPNLFAFGGKSTGNTTTFMPESLDRFDYLIACLKREGIYIYLDQLVNRQFTAADGVDVPDQLERAGKPYSNFDPQLIAVQQKFSRALLTHVNPYTKLAYKDEPAVALLEFANENDLMTQPVTLEPYRSRLEVRYRAWAAGKGYAVPPGKVSFGLREPHITEFLVAVQRDYYELMTRFMHDLGVKIPLTGSNWSINAGLLAALEPMPYTDSHAYHDHPSGNRFTNRPAIGSRSNMTAWLSFNRVTGKPFFVSEWDTPWPNEWRAELPLWLAAVASLQDWGGLTVYTYRHTAEVPCTWLSGAFETFNDPCRFGLFPAAALIYRRGDVSAARERVVVDIPRDRALGQSSPGPWHTPALELTPEVHRTEVALGGTRGVDYAKRVVTDERQVVSDTGQVRRRLGPDGYGSIDTPLTQAAYGHLAAAGELKLGDVTLRVTTPFAAVAVSSLSPTPLRSAERILVTAVARAENTGFAYTAERTGTAAKGTGPILTEPVRGTLALRSNRRTWRAVPVRADGSHGEPVPLVAANGQVTLELGRSATIYWLLEAQ